MAYYLVFVEPYRETQQTFPHMTKEPIKKQQEGGWEDGWKRWTGLRNTNCQL